MTGLSGVAHADAILELLEQTGVPVHEGRVPTNAKLPYNLLFQDDGSGVPTRMVPVSDRLDLRFQVTSVGLDRRGAQHAAQAARDAVLDVRPTVPGRSCWKVTQETAQPLRSDDDVTPPLLYLVAVYAWGSVPGPAVVTDLADFTPAGDFVLADFT